MSRDWGCDAKTPVQVRSVIRAAAISSAKLLSAVEMALLTSFSFDCATAAADLDPRFSAAAAFFAAAFFLLASDTIVAVARLCSDAHANPKI